MSSAASRFEMVGVFNGCKELAFGNDSYSYNPSETLKLEQQSKHALNHWQRNYKTIK